MPSSTRLYLLALQSFLVGVVVPNKHAVEDWAKDNGVSGSYEEILKNDKVIDFSLFVKVYAV